MELNLYDSQDTLNEMECIKAAEPKTDLDCHIEYIQYITKQTKKIIDDWKADSLEAFRNL